MVLELQAQLDGYLKGVITQVNAGSIGVKLLARVSAAGTETAVDYQESGTYRFRSGLAIGVGNTLSGASTATPTGTLDWFNQQSITLSNSTTIAWNTIADAPGTSAFAAARGGRFDEVHVVVIDDKGKISGNAGTILEKHLSYLKQRMLNSQQEVLLTGESI